MEGIVVFVGLVVLLIFLLPSLIAGARFRRLDDSLKRMEAEFRALKLEMRNGFEAQSKQKTTPPAAIEQVPPPPVEIIPPEVIQEPVPEEVSQPTPMPENVSVEIPELSEITISEEVTISETVFEEVKPRVVPQPLPPLVEKTPRDWEKFIGENLINKIGIAILTLGIGVFVKYAIDKDWINEVGRVVIGVFAAGLLLGIAHYMRKTYAAFSSVLVGGAIATLYFTIGIAFHEYKMFSQTQAFLLMVVITLFSVFISIAYDRIELAVIAQTGGFLTPFMVSTGEGNYVVLFSYLLILNVGLLVLAWYRKWHLVYIVSYVFTALIFGAWLMGRYDAAKATGAMVFATSFYLLFSIAATVFTLRKNHKLQAVQFLVLLSVNMLYFFAGLYIFNGIDHGKYKGLFTAVLGIGNFAAAYLLYKKENLDKNFIYLLIGLVLTYITLVAPIQLNGNKITLFWAAEMVILMFIYTKSQIRLLRLASVIIWPLLLVSLMMDWEGYGHGHVFIPFLNRYFISGFGSLVAMYLYIRLQVKNREEYTDQLLNIIVPITLVVGFVTGLFEIHHQFNTMGVNIISRRGNSVFLPDLIYAFSYILAIQWFSNKRNKVVYSMVGVVAFVILLFLYLYPGNNAIIEVRNFALSLPDHAQWPYFMHYMLWPLLILNFYFALHFIQNQFENILPAAYWITAFFGLYFLSAEADHITVWISNGSKNAQEALNFTHRAIYPVLWGISTFVVMYLGLKFKKRSLRILSLSIFAAILLKLFLIDIRDISEAGRIMAFITLGVILLVVSFLYQKLKVLLAKDDVQKTNDHA